MPIAIRTLLLLALSWLVSGAASADSLVYAIVPSESNTSTTVQALFLVDATPDFTEPLADEFPTFAQAVGVSNTQPSASSTLTADVGLPGNFDDGANGITISQWVLHYPELPGGLASIGFVTVPLEPTGSEIQPVAFNATVSELQITLNSPLSSSLTPTGTPNEWLWAGVGDVTVSGELHPRVVIPTVQEVALDPVPFSQALMVALTGTFSGDLAGTEVTVGIPSDDLQNLTLGPQQIDEQIPLLDALGVTLVTLDVLAGTFVLQDISGEAVYRNDQLPIPEPGTAALLGLGLTALALRRRR